MAAKEGVFFFRLSWLCSVRVFLIKILILIVKILFSPKEATVCASQQCSEQQNVVHNSSGVAFILVGGGICASLVGTRLL